MISHDTEKRVGELPRYLGCESFPRIRVGALGRAQKTTVAIVLGSPPGEVRSSRRSRPFFFSGFLGLSWPSPTPPAGPGARLCSVKCGGEHGGVPSGCCALRTVALMLWVAAPPQPTCPIFFSLVC